MLEKGQWLTGGAVGLVKVVSVGKKRTRLQQFGRPGTYFAETSLLERQLSEDGLSVIDEGSHPWNAARDIERKMVIEDIAKTMRRFGLRSVMRTRDRTVGYTIEDTILEAEEVDGDEL